MDPLFLIGTAAICTLACCTCSYVVLTRSARESQLLGRLEQLEQSRVNAQLALEGVEERCHELLDRTESKRRRFAAQEARQRDGEPEPEVPVVTPGAGREAVIRNVKLRLAQQGKL